MKQKWLKDTDLAERRGCSRSQIWHLVKTDPKFPKPKRLSAGMSRWDLEEIEEHERTLPDAI